MKTKHIFWILPFFLLACNSNDELSDAYGNFEVDDVVVSAEATGKLIDLNVEEGAELQEGLEVGLVDTTILFLKQKQMIAQQASVASKMENIRSQIDVQQQQRKNLLVDKARIENLLKDGAATQKQLDDINGKLDLIDSQIASIKTQFTSVKNELKVIQAQISEVAESIEKCHIKNPIHGTVLEKYAEANEVTAFGKPLYKIADMREMTLRVYVSGDLLPQIKIGQEVEVLIDSTGGEVHPMQGRVSWISDQAEFTPKIIQTKKERVNLVYAVKLRVKNNGTLKIGMPAEVNF